MSHGLQSHAQGQLPPRLDPRLQVDPQSAQRAKGAPKDMYMQQPPREHHSASQSSRRPAEKGQRVVSQPLGSYPDYSDPRNRDPWAAAAGSPPVPNPDWQNMQHNCRGVSEPPVHPGAHPGSAPPPSHQQQHRMPRQAHPPGPQQPHAQPPNGFASPPPPRISLDSSGSHGQRGTSPRPLPQPPQVHGGSPVYPDPHQTPIPSRSPEQWLQQPISQSSPHSSQVSVASQMRGPPSSRHSGSATASIRTEGSKTSLAGSTTPSVASRSEGTGESSHSARSVPAGGSVVALTDAPRAPEQTPAQSHAMPRLPNILAANSRPVEEGSPSRAMHIPLPQSPERPHQTPAFVPPPQASSTASLPPTLSSPIDVSAFYPASVVSASPNTSSSASSVPPPVPPKQPLSDPGHQRMSFPPATKLPHGAQAPTFVPAAYGRPLPGAQVPHPGQPYAQQMHYAQRPPQPQQHRGPPPPHHVHPHHVQQHPAPPPQQHAPGRQPGSVFSSATGLVPPPPSSKSPSRKLTRKKVVSALIPGR